MEIEKIPSPQEIKGKTQQFTPEELNTLRKFQYELENLVLQLGKMQLSKIKLEEQDTLLKNELKNMEIEEQKLAQTLTDKYGKGSLDIETGVFTSIE
jgi:hypothetical protein